MRFLILLSLLCLACFSVSSDEEGKSKLEELIKRSSQTSKISFDERDFERFIVKGPRPYWTLTILTAIKSNNCNPCQTLNPEFEKLARTIEEQRTTIKSTETNETNVFVAEVDFLDNREVFRKIGLSTAPMIVLIPPTKTHREIPLSKFFNVLGAKYQYSITQGRAAEDIGNWIAHLSKLPLSFSAKFEWPEWQYIAAAFSVLIIGIVFFNPLRKSMLGYAVICSLVYGFVMAGGMFSIIREVPFKGSGQSLQSFVSGDGYQYAAEGYILGALNVLAGLGAFLCFNSLRKRQEHPHVWFRWLSFLPSWVGLAIMAGACYAIMFIYTMKNGEYNMGHVGMEG